MNNCYTSTDGSSSTKTLLSLLGIVLFVSVLYSTGITIDSVWQAMIQTQPIYIFFMVITTVGIVGLTSIKWQIILRSLNICIYPAAGYYFYYCAIGLLSNSVIPQVGNYFLKARSLKNEFNVPTATSLQSVYQEQVFDLIILITIIGPSFLFFFKLTSVAMTRILYLFIVLAVVMLTLRSKRSIFQWINGVLVLLARFLSIFPVLRERFASAQALFNLPPPPNKTCLWLYFNSIIKYSIISARIYIVMVAIGIDFSYWHIFFGTPMIQIILLLGVTFGGIGASDAGWFFFLFSFGVDKNDIGNFLILERILSLGALSFVTFSSYLYYRAQVAYGTVRDGQTP